MDSPYYHGQTPHGGYYTMGPLPPTAFHFVPHTPTPQTGTPLSHSTLIPTHFYQRPETIVPPIRFRTPEPQERALKDTTSHNQAPATGSKRASAKTSEQKVSAVLTSIKENRFKNIGHFLQVFFDPNANYNKDPNVYHALSAFLAGRNSIGRRPADIVDAWYKHPKGIQSTDTMGADLRSIIPPFSIPVDLDAKLEWLNSESSSGTIGAHDGLEQWASTVSLSILDREYDALAVEPLLRPPATWSWDSLLAFNMQTLQETIIRSAPLTWSMFTTLAIGPTRREHSRSARIAAARALEYEMGSMDDDEGEVEDYEHWVDFLKHIPHSPWGACAFLITVVLFIRNHLISFAANFLGTILFMANTSRLVYSVLGRLGIVVSYTTVLKRLKALGHDAGLVAKSIGSKATEKKEYFVILFDNINKHHRAWHQNISNADAVQSGTAATAIKMVGVPPGAMDPAPLDEMRGRQARENLTVDTLLDDIDHEHLAAIGAATLLRVWTQYVPSLAHHRSTVNDLFHHSHKKHRIPRHKTEAFPLRTSGIDESTTAGNSDVLRDITHSQMGMSDKDFDNILLPVAGDQLTVDRVRKLKHYTARDVSTYARHSWALPFIQLWHMKWAFLKAIYKAHWSPNTAKGLHGLHRDCEAVGRTKLNPTKCDFYPHHHAVIDSFEALCCGVLRTLLDDSPVPNTAQPRGRTLAPDGHLLYILERSFAPGGRYAGTSFQFLQELAAVGYRRYMCTAAYEDALGVTQRDSAVYGTATSPHTVDLGVGEEGPNWNGDRQLANLILRLRDSFWYYEMNHAIAYGDIGRVMEIVKLLRFTFWGSGSTNYGNELLELACNFMYEYPEALQNALLNNWLVNPSGKAGHWHELDLLQEHYNLLIKTMFNSRDADFDSEFLQQAVALNIQGFSQLREALTSFFGIASNKGHHTDPKLDGDINMMGAHHFQNDLFHFHAGRRQSWKAPDFLATGIDKLAAGQLNTFKARTLKAWSQVQEEENEE
ncbi:hypothetical protein EYR40_010237 [Pleurotus pulmonarius]|nr:hypothetical protein EYR36_010372 [Pleurotus pulmonarius]KAF4588684.1 hypothetical protein EYR40_010237 [Pleurotus pulmonarius]